MKRLNKTLSSALIGLFLVGCSLLSVQRSPAESAFERPRAVADAPDLVSIIMSAHNSAATIGYAVRSILAQSYGNIELLICDDGSSDATSAELDKLRGDPRIRLFRSRGNQGTYGVRNSLIPEARGAYITFHDSDDFALPDRIERQLGFLKQEGAAAVAPSRRL